MLHVREFAFSLLVVAPLALGGCKKKDPAKCDEAMKTTRQALGSEDFALAKQWREYAYKNCDDGATLSGLDKEIVDKQAEVEKKKADAEALERETDQLVKLFTGWIAQHRANPEGAAVNVVCAEPADSKDHWCDRERSVGGKYQVKVRYWEADPEAQEYTTLAPGMVKCSQFGDTTEVSQKAGGAQKYCQITGGSLANMFVLIRHAGDGTHLNVVTQKFVDRHAGFRHLIQ
ncbi:MAG: hypothetical protein KC776_18090 [Myxococcales bacterium]|nr:hypothetical protein [Myxococcales bacterium]MCB9580853.1 hypothetical protein [Polyangiaceae bacterium]